MADRILITGANGFVGSALCPRLRESGYLVRAAIRDGERTVRSRRVGNADFEWVILHDQSDKQEVQDALAGVQVVIHLAARVHVMKDHSSEALREFRNVNLLWTERLARAAVASGVRRFVYLSSIKVNGERTVTPFSEEDCPAPQDPYGLSKWEAEQALAEVSMQTGLETVIVRSPLVYGPGVGGNFLQLLKAIRRQVPLPFASIDNRRSLVYLGNLVDVLIRCAQDKRAAGRTYVISDGKDLSTPELMKRLGAAMGTAVHLWPVPVSLLRCMAQMTGQRAAIDRLTGSLQVDSSRIRRELEWHPPFSVERGIANTAAWFMGLSTV